MKKLDYQARVYCGTVTADCLNRVVMVCGWVHRRRDHGGVIFIDLRDHTGIVQLTVSPQKEAIWAFTAAIAA